MQREARIFWTLIVMLLGASLFFGLGAEVRRREAQQGDTVVLTTGELVTLEHVLDGDTLMVVKADSSTVVIRLLGIKALDPQHERFGEDAAKALAGYLNGRSARVRVALTPDGKTKSDRHDRVIAELFVGDKNLGLELVKRGLALVYTPYPFDSISGYLEQQGRARDRGAGLWGDSKTARKADAMLDEWNERRESE